MSKKDASQDSTKNKIKELNREIDSINGFIDENQKDSLLLKYGVPRSVDMLVKIHNEKLIKNKQDKQPSKPKRTPRNKKRNKPKPLKTTKEKTTPKTITSNISKSQEKILSEISNSIKEFDYIVLEANDGNSDMAVKLANDFKSSIIITANEKAQNRYNKLYHLRSNSKIHLTTQMDFFNEKDIEKSDLLIIDDAHRLDENILNLFSYAIILSNYEDLISTFKKCEVKDLENQDYTLWIEFINHLSIDDEKIKRVSECIKQNPDNWICSYNEEYNRLSFYPLNVGNIAQKYWFSKGNKCILISSTILDFEMFVTELGLDSSKVKFLHYDLPFKSSKNKIYAKNCVNMQFEENKSLLIPIVEKILLNHQNDKGLILTGKNDYTYFINKKIKNNRLKIYTSFYKKLEEFKKSSNSVMISNSLEDGLDFPYNQCKFQIIIKQQYYPYNKRSKCKEIKSNWYSYKQMVYLMQILLRPTTSNNDYCKTYILDESILKSISKDIVYNKLIPEYIIDLIADLDLKDYGLVSQNLKRQFGVYYLFDYDTDKDYENEKIWKYKDYNKEIPNKYLAEFKFFTEKFMQAIAELSNQVIDDKINKIALVSVPSSTVERDNLATVKESINVIKKWYKEGKTESTFGCEKEIINCADLLTRVVDVVPSHNTKNRTSYIQHINTIECEQNNIFNEDDVAFIILDDISTRGTIMSACEDILIENGTEKENIYKFALYKTVW